MDFIRKSGLSLVLWAVMGLTQSAIAGIEYDQDVTPDVIFGSGNSNGHFTTDREGAVEVGLRAKIPYVGTTNSNGDGTYSYSLAETAQPFLSLGKCSGEKCWNFEFTVNTDYDDTSGARLDGYTYELGMDQDPGLGTDFVTFDPITPSGGAPDHSIGDNDTPNGGGAEAVDEADYINLLANNNVLQQSWRYAWMPVSYDPDIPGTYAVYFLVRDGDNNVVARTDIQVLIGGALPAPPSLACSGFQSPLDDDVAVKKPNRVLPLRMNLLDGDGVSLTNADITANPVLQVTFDGGTYTGSADLESLDTAGRGDDGNMFVFDDPWWGFNMKTKDLAPGHYTISVVSGDATEYVIDPTCEVGLSIQ